MAKATKVNEVVVLTPTKLGAVREMPKGSKRKFSVALMQNEHHIAQFFCDDKKTAEELIGKKCAVIAVERKDKDEKPFLRFEYYSSWSAYVSDQHTAMEATDEIVKATLLNDLQLKLVKERASSAGVNSAALAAAL